MRFENEMDQFFVRNCYPESERLRVKACPAYRLAAENNDTIQAQEIATQVLEDRLGRPKEQRNWSLTDFQAVSASKSA
jgi:hypothetical protein